MSAPMRVVAFVHGAYPYLRAGSETMLDAMLADLADNGHEVHVVTTTHGPDGGWWFNGVIGHRADRHRAGAVVAGLDPDVIVTHHEHAPDAIALARDIGCAAVGIVHNDFGLSRRIINAGPDLVVYNTHWLRARLRPGRRPYIVVHPPLNAARYADAVTGDAVTMVNLFKIKGPNVLWALAANHPDRRFLAVRGGYGDQDERGGYANVDVIDSTTDMPGDVWAHTRVLIVPSRYESYGLAACEALACGIPVVAAPTAGLREALGPAGIWANRGDLRRWSRMLDVLDDPAVYANASARARARARALDRLRLVELAAWRKAVAVTASRVRGRRFAPTVTGSHSVPG